MRKLVQFCKHLKDTTKLPRENFTAYADSGDLTPHMRDLGHGIEVGRFKYEAVVQIDRYSGDGFHLLAIATAWLQNHDPERESQDLADPQLNINLNMDGTADVEFGVEFSEAIELMPDEKGPIEYDGRNWRIAPVEIDVAMDLTKMEGKSHAE